MILPRTKFLLLLHHFSPDTTSKIILVLLALGTSSESELKTIWIRSKSFFPISPIVIRLKLRCLILTLFPVLLRILTICLLELLRSFVLRILRQAVYYFLKFAVSWWQALVSRYIFVVLHVVAFVLKAIVITNNLRLFLFGDLEVLHLFIQNCNLIVRFIAL